MRGPHVRWCGRGRVNPAPYPIVPSGRSGKVRDVTLAIDVEVLSEGVSLPGLLEVPPGAASVVVFAHGSGSGRLSPRNAAVAEALHAGGLASLLFDLLTEEEAADRRNVFDVELLGGRLVAAIGLVVEHPAVGGRPVGVFGASTGAAAAIAAAARVPERVSSIVSRGGRPDLAGRALALVTAPTLLIVGGLDTEVLGLNRDAMRSMTGAETRLEVVADATHLFEEPGALERVAGLAASWFVEHA
jgi:putative phosphoribosyl transferase